MSVQTILLLVLVGIAAGILSGLIGLSGGIIIVPALVLLFGFSQKEAQGTTLATLLLLIGLFAMYGYYQQGRIKISFAIIVAVAFFIGSYLGSRFSFTISKQKLKRIFAITIMLLSIRMLFFEQQKKPAPPTAKENTSSKISN
ncbi:MAG: sulfite exporter TauE/SafE family protein [Bacteroidota bacterium]|nr:sulfite exporter TauE/SafE family protein [Bacteroidota bacterium]